MDTFPYLIFLYPAQCIHNLIISLSNDISECHFSSSRDNSKRNSRRESSIESSASNDIGKIGFDLLYNSVDQERRNKKIKQKGVKNIRKDP